MESEGIHSLLREYRSRLTVSLADAPPGLLDEMLPSLRIRTAPTTALAELEALLPVALPPSFRAYLLGPAVEHGIEWSEIILPANSPNDLGRDMLLQESLWSLQLLQFAYGPCGDPVCFDFADTASPEYPVVIINHDRAASEDWEDPVRIRRFVHARFTSFEDLLKALCLGQPVDYLHI